MQNKKLYVGNIGKVRLLSSSKIMYRKFVMTMEVMLAQLSSADVNVE